ncbi:MAG: hypothetical protein WDN72_05740 [Alphaproteobacteria bacterium]
MKMKQISARNMQEAMTIAKRELGDDAVLLDNRKVAGGGVSVTFAVEEDDSALLIEDPADILPFSPNIARSAAGGIETRHPALDLITQALELHNVPLSLSERILRRAAQARFTPDALIDTAEAALAEALADILVFRPIATGAEPPKRALMLVGAYGAGKTSALAKLATELTLAKQRVVLVSSDNERMGALDTLDGLSKILKCEFCVAENRATLKPILKSTVGKAWVLIDTSGVNIYEFKQLKGLGELGTLADVEPILTCPAGIDAHEAQEMAGVLSFLDIERMVVTRVDAARRLSSVFAALATGGLALANQSSSASPSDACTPISAPLLARLMLREAREKLTQ